MIFGEYLGEVVSNGEYEVRAQGTTLAGLQAAVDALTWEEYWDSFLTIGDSGYIGSSNDVILKPYTSTTKLYLHDMVHTVNPSTNTSITTYYANGTIYEVVKEISGGTVTRNTRSSSGSGSSLITLSAWTLYTRKQTLAIPGAGDEMTVIAEVIGNGVKTYSQIFDELFALTDISLAKRHTNTIKLMIGDNIYTASIIGDNILRFFNSRAADGAGAIYQTVTLDIVASGSLYNYLYITPQKSIIIDTSNASAVVPSGTSIKIVI